jgi:outer membrane protein OmpA-like peptidoglycan-associated protein
MTFVDTQRSGASRRATRSIPIARARFFAKALPASAALVLLSACGHAAVSEQLTDARKSVKAAQKGDARRVAPDEVERADRLLDRAEDQKNGSGLEQHYAYLADRQARIAMAEAGRARLSQAAQAERQSYVRDLEESAAGQRAEVESKAAQLESQSQQLDEVHRELAEVRAELQQRGQEVSERTESLRARERELAQREAQLMQAQQAQQKSEQRAEEAMQRLAEIAQVQQSQANTIITLTGEVLFETDQATLLPQARQRLGQVANALKASPHEEIVIEGHTDNQGSPEHNQQLSQERANSVRAFLESQGVPGRIEAVGRGETEPIADNTSPEGRALNRRVEIIMPKQQQ